MNNNHYPFINTPLPYDYDALEPFIDTKTMYLHHDKHLQTYIDNLNNTLREHPNLQDLSLKQLIVSSCKLPQPLRTSVRNNAGGIYNHRFFFKGLKNPSSGKPSGSLADAIDQRFGSFHAFLDLFKKAALSVFGSGYAWLIADKGKLSIITTANQDTPIEYGFDPILNIAVWEHAYYLKHYNVRADYIDDWMQIINWTQAEKNYEESVE